MVTEASASQIGPSGSASIHHPTNSPDNQATVGEKQYTAHQHMAVFLEAFSHGNLHLFLESSSGMLSSLSSLGGLAFVSVDKIDTRPSFVG